MKKISNTWGAAIISAATLMTFTGCAFKQPVYTAASTSGDAAANTSVTATSTSASEAGTIRSMHTVHFLHASKTLN